MSGYVTYSYGEMPPYSVFSKQIDEDTPPEHGVGIAYPMELVDDDEIGAVQAILSNMHKTSYKESWTRQHKYKVVISGKRNLYRFVKDLTLFGEQAYEIDEEQSEAVLNLASSILGTLNIEWV